MDYTSSASTLEVSEGRAICEEDVSFGGGLNEAKNIGYLSVGECLCCLELSSGAAPGGTELSPVRGVVRWRGRERRGRRDPVEVWFRVGVVLKQVKELSNTLELVKGCCGCWKVERKVEWSGRPGGDLLLRQPGVGLAPGVPLLPEQVLLGETQQRSKDASSKLDPTETEWLHMADHLKSRTRWASTCPDNRGKRGGLDVVECLEEALWAVHEAEGAVLKGGADPVCVHLTQGLPVWAPSEAREVLERTNSSGGAL